MESEIPQFDQIDRMWKSLRVAGMKAGHMADHLGVTRETVSRWMVGRTRPSEATLRAWADRTGVPYDWLVNG